MARDRRKNQPVAPECWGHHGAKTHRCIRCNPSSLFSEVIDEAPLSSIELRQPRLLKRILRLRLVRRRRS